MITLHVTEDQARTLGVACGLLGEVSRGAVAAVEAEGHDAGDGRAKLTDLASMASRLRYAKDGATLDLSNG